MPIMPIKPPSGGTVSSLPWTSVTGKPTFANVATSGAYNDLSSKPTTVAAAGLTDAVNTSALTTTLADYAPMNWCTATFATTSALSNYATTSSLSAYATTSSLSNYITSTALTNALSGYVTSSAISSTLANYATTSSLSGYVTSSGLATTLNGYVTVSGLTTTLNNYATTASLSGYATTSSLSGYVSNSALTSALSFYPTSSSLTTTLGGYATTSSLTSGLAGKFNTPTGTTAQYIRGDGSLAAFPGLFDGSYASLTGKPALATVATSGSYNDLTNKPTIVNFMVGTPVTKSTPALATAYQATDNTKPTLVTVNITSTSSISLGGTSNNEGGIWIGATNAVTAGTGTLIGSYKNSLGGALVVGLTVTSAQTQPYSFVLPAGWYWAARQTVGTGMTIVSVFDQSLT